MPFDAWDSLGLQENVFLVINVLHLVRQEILLKESLRCDTRCYRTRNTKRDRISSSSNRTGTSFARDDEQNKGTIPMQMFARRPSTMSSSIPVEIPQNSMVGQQRQLISELQFDKFLTPASFFMLEDKIQASSDYLF